jgi:hypothetical protein
VTSRIRAAIVRAYRRLPKTIEVDKRILMNRLVVGILKKPPKAPTLD